MQSNPFPVMMPELNPVPENTAARRGIREICLLEPRLPRHCKIASATAALRDALAAEYPGLACHIMTVDAPQHESLTPHGGDACRSAAQRLNESAAEVACLQHGSGIYAGPGGSFLAAFVQELKKPLVTAFHMIEPDPTPAEQRVMETLFRGSVRLVTMTRAGRDILRERYRAPLRKIEVIPHGIPDRPPRLSTECKEAAGLAGRKVLLTFGHLEPHKGIEHVIRALPAVIRQHPDVLYVVIGATEPKVLDAEGEAYRTQLREIVQECAVGDHVRFLNEYMDDAELDLYIGAADICLTPYDVEARVCSANLARMVGMGRPVVSTSYTHAREMLADGRGRLVRFASPMAISGAILELLGDADAACSLAQRAWAYGRKMVWPAVARSYMECFASVVDRHEASGAGRWSRPACDAASAFGAFR